MSRAVMNPGSSRGALGIKGDLSDILATVTASPVR
jgi:hypothetical protein